MTPEQTFHEGYNKTLRGLQILETFRKLPGGATLDSVNLLLDTAYNDLCEGHELMEQAFKEAQP